MDVPEAFNIARSIASERADSSMSPARALVALATEVERLREQPRPRSMESAPRVWDPPIYLVHRAPWEDCYKVPADGMVTRLGQWSDRDQFWNVNNYKVEPIGWWPVPTTTAEQIAELTTTTDEQVGQTPGPRGGG